MKIVLRSVEIFGDWEIFFGAKDFVGGFHGFFCVFDFLK